MQPVGELVLVEAFGRLDGSRHDLQIGVGEGRQVIAERVDPFGGRSRLVFLQEFLDAREVQGFCRLPEIEIDYAVELRAELLLDRSILQPDKATAEDLGLEADLVGGPHHADRVGRIGQAQHDIRIGRVDRPHDRGVIGRGRRVGLVVDDVEPGRLGVLARALGAVAREFGVAGDDRDGLRLRVLGRRDLEKPLREADRRVGTAGRHHREIPRVLELAVHIEAEQREERHLVLHHDRHRRRQQIGAVVTHHDVDFVDLEQLGEDPRHGRRVALVVVIDQLHRPAQHPALGVGLLLPDLHRQQGSLAAGGEPAGQPHAEADLDRVGGARRRQTGSAQQERGGEQRQEFWCVA